MFLNRITLVSGTSITEIPFLYAFSRNPRTFALFDESFHEGKKFIVLQQ